MLTFPRAELTLEQVSGIARDLMRRGASIDEFNTVRKHTEQLKGGGLARASRAERITVLVLSDVVGDRLDVIGSGLFAADPTTFADARAVIDKYGSADAHPEVTRYIEAGVNGKRAETAKPGDPLLDRVTHEVLANHESAAAACAQCAEQQGYTLGSRTAHLGGSAASWADRLIDVASRPVESPACYILAGEPTVDVGDASGRGGPSQEVAARWLLATAESPPPGPRALMTFSTDGIDGPTPNAGGVILGEHIAAARARLPWLRERLADHDSATALEALGAALQTGPTGTNVNHIALLLALPADANSRPPEYHTANV